MRIETLQAEAPTAIDQWALGAGGSKAIAVAPPGDDDTSYISEVTLSEIQEFECTDVVGILSADTISQVNLKYRAKRVGGSMMTLRAGLRVGGGTLEEGASQSMITSYGDFNDVFANNPDAGPWSLADLNALRIRIRLNTAIGGEARVTSLSAEITYVRASDKSQHSVTIGVG